MNADLSSSDARLGALLAAVPAHGVQAMGAWCVADLQRAARALGQRFLHADLRAVQSRAEAMTCLAQALALPAYFGGNLDALHDCLTDLEVLPAAASGLVVVLEQIPLAAGGGDRQAHEMLLECFRDAAGYWAENRAGQGAGVAFRCFYSLLP